MEAQRKRVIIIRWGFPGNTSGKKIPPPNAGDVRDMDLIPSSGRSPRGELGLPTPVFLPGESYGSISGVPPFLLQFSPVQSLGHV